MPDVRQSKGGRPPKPSASRLCEEIKTQLPVEQAEEVRRRATLHGYTVAEYVRLMLGFSADETDYLPN